MRRVSRVSNITAISVYLRPAATVVCCYSISWFSVSYLCVLLKVKTHCFVLPLLMMIYFRVSCLFCLFFGRLSWAPSEPVRAPYFGRNTRISTKWLLKKNQPRKTKEGCQHVEYSLKCVGNIHAFYPVPLAQIIQHWVGRQGRVPGLEDWDGNDSVMSTKSRIKKDICQGRFQVSR